jgi:hypothetical protein
MKTFREDLLRHAFEQRWPLFATPMESADWFERHPDPPEMKRAFELGLTRKRRELTPEEIVELNALSDASGFYARWTEETAAERERAKAWDRAVKQAELSLRGGTLPPGD